jgi:Ser/Thr protein kinase RdoA (MazF antagonist)
MSATSSEVRLRGPSAAVEYLVRLGLLSTHEVVLGHVEVADVSRRNRVYAVASGRAGGFILKQGRDESGAELLRREAESYSLLRSSGLSSLAPIFRHWDPLTEILVLERASCTLGEWIRTPDRDMAQAGLLLGTCLARLHSEMPAEGAGSGRDCDTPGDRFDAVPFDAVPWVLHLWCPPAAQVETMGPGSRALLRRLQARGGLCRGLRQLAERYAPDSRIHGDLKADNVVVTVGAFGEPAATQLIDWEASGPGESVWDLGCLLGECLLARAASKVPGGSESAGPGAATAVLGRAVWDSYWSYRTERSAAAPDVSSLARVLQLAAARCVQTAFERARSSRAAPRPSLELLRMAERVMTRPLDAAARIYGLPASMARMTGLA